MPAFSKQFCLRCVAGLMMCLLLFANLVGHWRFFQALGGTANLYSHSQSQVMKMRERMKDPHPTNDFVEVGVLSAQPFEFFQRLREAIDQENHTIRCNQYGYSYQGRTDPRRIFYGALIANEPWELFEIVGAEAYGLFAAMVFVEGNRTQTFTPRNVSRLQHGPQLAHIFGLSPEQIMMRLFVNEDPDRWKSDFIQGLSREHAQRQDIIQGWAEMGMTGDDLGYLCDSDEIFSRDFLVALQYCDDMPGVNYETGRCYHKQNGMKSTTLIFEGSPECPTNHRKGYRPDVFIGHCIDGIGDSSGHPKAARPRPDSMDSTKDRWAIEDNITDGRYPLYSGADMRRIGGYRMERRKREGYSEFSGYHFHNFFSSASVLRNKYVTYGHSHPNAAKVPLHTIHEDLDTMNRCVLNDTTPSKRFSSVPGGLLGMKPPYPIYFHDADYRERRHNFMASLTRSQ